MKRIFKITIIALAVSVILQFIIYSFNEDSRYHVSGNYDDDLNFINYSVQHEWTAKLYSLDDLQIHLFWFTCLSLSIASIIYIYLTPTKTKIHSTLEALERENEIIRKQIEKKELLEKLETLEKK